MIEPTDEELDGFIKGVLLMNGELYILYLQLRSGYWNYKDAFHIWKNIMTWDLERLNKRFCGLNAFDEFYSVLNGRWDGDR